MYVFGNDKGSRGCYAAFNIHSISRGAYLQLPSGNELPYGIGGDADAGGLTVDPYIVTGLSYGQKEKYHLVQCFNDTVHTYAFGHDPTSSIVSVQFTAFIMNQSGDTWSEVFQTFNREYRDSRVSVSPTYAYVCFGSAVLKGFVIGMSSQTQDQQHNLQSFSMDLLAVEVHE